MVGLIVRYNELIRETAGEGAVPAFSGLGPFAAVIMVIGIVVAFGMTLRVYFLETRKNDGSQRGNSENQLQELTENPVNWGQLWSRQGC